MSGAVELEAELRHLRTALIAAEAERDTLLAQVEAMAGDMRNIAEGNLGDAPWQANYDRIRNVASAVLSKEPQS